VEAIIIAILGSPLTPVSLASVVLTLIIVSLIRGWLLPKSTVLLLIQAEQAIAKNYKEAWEAERAMRETLIEYLQKLLTYAETADKVLKSIPLPPGTIAVVPVPSETLIKAPEGGTQ
jgi:hypothetical protein